MCVIANACECLRLPACMLHFHKSAASVHVCVSERVHEWRLVRTSAFLCAYLCVLRMWE